MAPKGLMDRISSGEDVICAEGYLFEFERRGYLKAGAFVPEVVLEHPDLVRLLYEEFVHAGSDVVQAFTYYGHRAKLRVIGREDDLEKMNRQALKMAREVADKTGTLMAGNICNTGTFIANDTQSAEETKQIFKEQIEWAVEEGADFIIGETYTILQEAELALQCIKQYGKGLPAVITMTPTGLDTVVDDPDMTFPQAVKKLEDQGADVVGLNCMRGLDTTLPLIREARKLCKGPIACLPVPYRTSPKDGVTFFQLKDQFTGEPSFPADLDPWLSSRSHVARFTKEMKEIGVQYMGLCCGNRAGHTRTMAETLGRTPPASRYSPNMANHISKVDTGTKHNYTKDNWGKHFKQ